MNKYSYIAIFLSVVIGFVAGYLVLGSSSNKAQIKLLKEYELKLKHQEDSSKQIIKKLNIKLLSLENQYRVDSVKIKSLLFKIQQDEVRTEQKRKDIQKLNTNEKVDYLLKRYSN